MTAPAGTGLPPGLPEALLDLPVHKIEEMLCRANPGVWAERIRGYQNAPFHWEWYAWAQRVQRGALIAPRDHAKTETLTVNMSAWRSIYQPGTWTYVFAATLDQAMGLKERIDDAVEEHHPELVERAKMKTKAQTVYRNGSRITVAGAGKAVRSAHPDVIIGDDVLEESSTLTSYQRKKTERWWMGTVANMAHPGTVRRLPNRTRVKMPPTRILLVGTPFHQHDLLMGMETNPLYSFRRYAAEFNESDLVDGLAVAAN